MNNLAIYYENIKKDYAKAEKYYLMAIEQGNNSAMNNLARHCANIKKDYTNAEKYYLMAIEQGNVNAMNNLANYYAIIKKDYTSAEKYYLMAIEQGNVVAMNNLANYYEKIKQDYTTAEKYYLMAVERGNVVAMNNLASYYAIIKKDYTNAEKYYLMAIEQGNNSAMNNLADHYENNNDLFKLMELCITYHKLLARDRIINIINKIWIIKLDNEQNKYLIELLLLLELQPNDNILTSLRLFNNLLHQNIDIVKLHFEYTINGKGYENAKQDFLNSVTSTKINNSQ
jgi:TPR repeat protein